VSFSDLADHIAEAFAPAPGRYADAEARARRAHLARHSESQQTYRWKHGLHPAICRLSRARCKPQAALVAGVWREVRAASRDAWRHREAVAWVLYEIRGGRA
jgi:hypothetical protein